MSLTNTPVSERIHIAFFGNRNAGKSSIINAVTAQKLSIVSDVRGTTTDPVFKTMELLPLGPVVIIDTPGVDDTGELGLMRVERAYEVLNKTDIAVVIIDASVGKTDFDNELIKRIEEKKLPYVVCYNKSDIKETEILKENEICVSAKTGKNIHELKELIAGMKETEKPKKLLGDLLCPGDAVILVMPVDSGAPKGRLILPQQHAIRDLLESSCISVGVQVSELPSALNILGERAKLVVTDSQAFGLIKDIVPESVPLTSFSILFLRYKGELDTAINGARALDSLHDGDTVLISEGCTHHRQCDDIGSVKLPKWISAYTGKKLNFEFSSGGGFPREPGRYSLIVHCGGCMLNEKEVKSRIKKAESENVPFTNYGILIAYMNGILKRCVKPLGIEI